MRPRSDPRPAVPTATTNQAKRTRRNGFRHNGSHHEVVAQSVGELRQGVGGQRGHEHQVGPLAKLRRHSRRAEQSSVKPSRSRRHRAKPGGGARRPEEGETEMGETIALPLATAFGIVRERGGLSVHAVRQVAQTFLTRLHLRCRH